MQPLSSLEHRLRQARYLKGSQACARVLENVGIPANEEDFLRLEEVDEIWPRYISVLRHDSANASRWSAGQSEVLQRHVDQIGEAVDGMRAVWLALVNTEPVGVEVSAEALLRAASVYFVSLAGDLMLTTRDTSHGICIELNHLPSGDEYEVVAWGAFQAK